MQNKETINKVSDCIILVKLFNTMWGGTAYQKQKEHQLCLNNLCDEFWRLLRVKYIDYAVDKFDAHFRSGTDSYYSAKYDLGIGF